PARVDFRGLLEGTRNYGSRSSSSWKTLGEGLLLPLRRGLKNQHSVLSGLESVGEHLSSLRDSDQFPTLPSAPPAAPCWAKLFRAYFHPSSRKSGANRGPRLRRWIFDQQTPLTNTKSRFHTRSKCRLYPNNRPAQRF